MANFPGKLDIIRVDYRKLAVYCIVAGIIFSLYDVLFDLVLSFLHTIFDMALSFLHSLFEWFEYGLEELIEHIFHTTRQQTQTIVFYLLLAVGAFACYRLGLKLQVLYRQLKIKTLTEWVKIKIRTSLFWHHQSKLEKLKLIFTGSVGIMILTFLMFS